MTQSAITKDFIESLGWKPSGTSSGYTRMLQDGHMQWVRGKTYHYELNGKKITHTQGSNFCLFLGNGYRLHSATFDKIQLVDYTALLKKLLNIKKNPYLYTAGEYLEVTKKLAALTR